MTLLRALPLIGLALLAPAGASAATVRVAPGATPGQKGGSYTLPGMFVEDAAGTDDVLSIVRSGKDLGVSGGPLEVGLGCALERPDRARCTVAGSTADYNDQGVTDLSVDLGAGNDQLTLEGPLEPFAPVLGGAGDDTITSVSTATRWDGGPGADRVAGAPVQIVYATRQAGVSVTFDGVANDGEAGEGDDVGAASDGLLPNGSRPIAVTGGAGPDHIETGDGPAAVVGGDGDDTIIGGAGADDLAGGSSSFADSTPDGDDTLVGGGVTMCCPAAAASTSSTAAPATTSCGAARAGRGSACSASTAGPEPTTPPRPAPDR